MYYAPILISTSIAFLFDLVIELFKYFQKSKCKVKVEYNDPEKSLDPL